MSNQNNPHSQERPAPSPKPQTGQQRGTGPREPKTKTR